MDYKAFVSSTFKDLREHRTYVIAKLRNAGVHVDPMEEWTATADEPQQFSQRRVDGCQLCILLVARRRGYVPNGQTRSITQLEYDYAINQGIDVLPFLLDDNSRWNREFNELDSDPQMRPWRQALSKRHGVTFFNNEPSSIDISSAVARWLNERIKQQTPAAADPLISFLHQLPPPPPDFTGRQVELEELLSMAASGVNICGVRGAGGIGKTVLALKLAEHLSKEYSDAQFYLDLRGADEQRPLTPSDAMQHVIRSYQPTAKLPNDTAQLETMYRSVLSGRSVLLLMDNARDASQVAPLIPPKGCYLLVTSRQRFTLPGLNATNLDVLREEDARALLLKICPRLERTADNLSELCGRYALALRVSASTLATRDDLTPDDYLDELRDSKAYLDKVADDYQRSAAASISLSYKKLNGVLQQRWCMLACFPETTFDRKATASLWDVDQKSASKTLGELLCYSLVEWNETTKRYHLHDLVRQVANERLAQFAADE